MKPSFPEKNSSVNGLIELRSVKMIAEFAKHFKEPDYYYHQHGLGWKISHLKKQFAYFNEEVSQVIHTTNDQTKISFFEELKENINDFELMNTDFEYFVAIVERWNKDKLDAYDNKVNVDTAAYMASEARTKYAHNEVYQQYVFNIFTHSSVLTTFTNHNFCCVDEKLEIIEEEDLTTYLRILEDLTYHFKKAFEKEIRLYEDGKLVNQAKAENRTDRWLNKIKDNPIVAAIIIIVLVVGSTATTITSINGCREITSPKDNHKKEADSLKSPLLGTPKK